MLASVDFDFIGYKTKCFAPDTHRDQIRCNYKLTDPGKYIALKIVRYRGIPNCKEECSFKWLKVQSLVVHTPGKTS